MKASPQLSNVTLVSELSQRNSTEVEYNRLFHCNVYEFQDIEDPTITRSLGYQKPKHMWMAKDQAPAESTKPNNLSAADRVLTEFTTVSCIEFPTHDSLPFQSVSAIGITSLSASPVHSAYISGSPSTVSSTQGLSATLSSSLTNTSSSLYSHTPPNSGHGFSTTGSASSCTSPSLAEMQLTKHPVIDGSTEDPISDKSLETNRTHPLPTTKANVNGVICKRNLVATAGRRKTAVNKSVRKQTITTASGMESSQSFTESSVGAKKPRQKRQTGLIRRNSVGSNKRSQSQHGRLTLTLSLCSLSKPATVQSDQQDLSSKSCVAVIRRRKLRPSKSLPSQSPFVPGGLKIRLRRDSAPLDVAPGRSKRARNKTESTGTFRIVESWCDADAPGGEFSQRASATISTSSSPSFALTSGSIRVGDIVWAKLAGYPYWPSRVSAIWARTVHQLSQAIPVPNSQPNDNTGSPSLSVLATPADPALAAGYTARVDWLAWDQCSYLSCAKLYPFKDTYDKLYNPRTRVKGYADAVRLAKRYCFDAQSGTACNIDPHVMTHSSPLKTLFNPPGHASVPTSTDSQWSELHPCPVVDPPTSVQQVLPTHTLPATDNHLVDMNNSNATLCLPESGTQIPLAALAQTYHPDVPVGTPLAADPTEEPVDLSALGGLPLWTPLPQLDVSGLGDFVTHMPTFSEDEEDEVEDSVANELQIDFDACM
ncbi:hypothetical protein FGIG_10553 [Fasciola gigantica]|uniref:PWWP domain-containing protein n=1 Tax=Fasciola gigantica TaxID=46835 RepID=A0A504YP88_FASGI|nr:hypothetical protein FGIG_10553 [Fasciola gigantica]